MTRTARPGLCREERLDLVAGDRGAFPDEQTRRAAWVAWRDDLLRDSRPGRRPVAWWDFHGRVARDERVPQARQLHEAGLLTAQERALLEPAWRRLEVQVFRVTQDAHPRVSQEVRYHRACGDIPAALRRSEMGPPPEPPADPREALMWEW